MDHPRSGKISSRSTIVRSDMIPNRPRLTCFLLCTIISSLCAAQTYSVTDLGPLPGGSFSVGAGINASGQVAGSSGSMGNANGDAVLYTNGVPTDLGNLGGGWSEAFQVNSSGEVVGYAPLSDGNNRCFVFRNGHLVTLPTLGGDWCDGFAINDFGEVVGQSFSATNTYQGFIFSKGKMTNLGNLGADIETYAFGINNAHQVVGYSWNTHSEFQAFLWQKGKMKSLGTLGGPYSVAYGINDAGQVTGYAALAGNTVNHAFLFSGGKMTDIDTLDDGLSVGMGINRLGVVVGYRDVGANTSAFIFTSGAMVDLNTLIPQNSGWVLQEAKGINDAGQITGTGTFNGNERGFLLTPQ